MFFFALDHSANLLDLIRASGALHFRESKLIATAEKYRQKKNGKRNRQKVKMRGTERERERQRDRGEKKMHFTPKPTITVSSLT